MKTIRITLAVLVALVAVTLQQQPTTTLATTTSLVDACSSLVDLPYGPGSGHLIACPAGDGQTIENGVGIIRLLVRDPTATPIDGIPATDVWLIDCDPVNDLTLCGGSASSNADSATNMYGYTTISTSRLAAGGCVSGLAVVVQGVVLNDPASLCDDPYCLPVEVRSVDINGDRKVDIMDWALVYGAWPPGPYDTCADIDGDAEIGLRDFVYMVLHKNHSCD